MQAGNRGQFVGGVIFLLCGVLIWYLAITERLEQADNMPLMVGCVGGGMFFLVGLMLTQVPQYVLTRRFQWAQRVEWESLLGGLIAALMGGLLMVISVLDPDESSFSAGRGVVTAAGATFFLAGLLILRGAAVKGGGSGGDLLTGILAALLVSTFAAVPIGILFNGELTGLVEKGVVGCASLFMAALAAATWFGVFKGVWKTAAPLVTRYPLMALIMLIGLVSAVIAVAVAIQRAAEPR